MTREEIEAMADRQEQCPPPTPEQLALLKSLIGA